MDFANINILSEFSDLRLQIIPTLSGQVMIPDLRFSCTFALCEIRKPKPNSKFLRISPSSKTPDAPHLKLSLL